MQSNAIKLKPIYQSEKQQEMQIIELYWTVTILIYYLNTVVNMCDTLRGPTTGGFRLKRTNNFISCVSVRCKLNFGIWANKYVLYSQDMHKVFKHEIGIGIGIFK